MVLICISLINSYAEHIFMFVVCMSSLERTSIQVVCLLCSILLKLSFMDSLYILDINPNQIYHLPIYFHLFILLVVFFAMKSFLA